MPKPTSRKYNLKLTLAHLLGTPAYIVWLLGWLLLITTLLTRFASSSSIIPISSSSSQFDLLVNLQPVTAIEGSFFFILVFALWYLIASIIRESFHRICQKLPNPVLSFMIILFGGVIIGWGGFGLSLYSNEMVRMQLVGLIGLPISIGIVSFCLELLLTHIWHIDQLT